MCCECAENVEHYIIPSTVNVSTENLYLKKKISKALISYGFTIVSKNEAIPITDYRADTLTIE